MQFYSFALYLIILTLFHVRLDPLAEFRHSRIGGGFRTVAVLVPESDHSHKDIVDDQRPPGVPNAGSDVPFAARA